jgi:hypothetical protein
MTPPDDALRVDAEPPCTPTGLTIVCDRDASDGWDVTVDCPDGVRRVFHSAAGRPEDPEAWVAECVAALPVEDTAPTEEPIVYSAAEVEAIIAERDTAVAELQATKADLEVSRAELVKAQDELAAVTLEVDRGDVLQPRDG